MSEPMSDEELFRMTRTLEGGWVLPRADRNRLIAEVERLRGELTVREVLERMKTGEYWEHAEQPGGALFWVMRNRSDDCYTIPGEYVCTFDEALAAIVEHVRGKR